jgi:hypothetical protein
VDNATAQDLETFGYRIERDGLNPRWILETYTESPEFPGCAETHTDMFSTKQAARTHIQQVKAAAAQPGTTAEPASRAEATPGKEPAVKLTHDQCMAIAAEHSLTGKEAEAEYRGYLAAWQETERTGAEPPTWFSPPIQDPPAVTEHEAEAGQ